MVIKKTHPVSKGSKITDRDVKCDNVLYDRNSGSVKLCDLGLAVQCLRECEGGLGARCDSVSGTLLYAPPELIRGNGAPYNPFLGDVWSLGVVLYVLLTAKQPFGGSDGSDETAVRRRVLSSEPFPLPPSLASAPSHVYDLLCRVLVKDAAMRSPLNSLLSHPFVALSSELSLLPDEPPSQCRTPLRLEPPSDMPLEAESISRQELRSLLASTELASAGLHCRCSSSSSTAAAAAAAGSSFALQTSRTVGNLAVVAPITATASQSQALHDNCDRQPTRSAVPKLVTSLKRTLAHIRGSQKSRSGSASTEFTLSADTLQASPPLPDAADSTGAFRDN